MRTSTKVKIGGVSLLLALGVIQFFQPTRNSEAGPYVNDITRAVYVPDSIHHLLQIGCYDCHSNSTSYPWYSRIQPGGWYLSQHITEGKAELNFHDFGTYSQRKQRSKLKAIAGQLEEGEMPLKSYKWLHPEARFTPQQVHQISMWATRAADSLGL